jgi:hypothetical protein
MPRDLEYERNNIVYDEQCTVENGGGIKCKNYRFCKGILPIWWYNCKEKYLCTSCDMFGWGELIIFESNDDCAVCMEGGKPTVMFPADCGHFFCVDCTRRCLFWDETLLHLSPVPYGCPPCPNGCNNPIKGRQCYCEEYDAVQERWKIENIDQYNRWNEDEHISIETPVEGLINGSKECPLCRKKYEH